jgi:glucosamine-6-phosphate deaminase
MLQEFKADQLTVKIFADRHALGEAAAAMAAATLRNLLAHKEEVNVIFAAAPSQQEFLDALKVAPGIAWNRVNAFHMDEYIGLPADAPQGFGNFLRRAIFDALDFKSVCYINEALNETRYPQLLVAYPPDMVCMGIGENGHLAFNDPPVADFNDQLLVKVVELDLACRQQQVNDGCFAQLEEVPTHAVTLTIPAMMQAPHIYCMVPGPTKAVAVRNTMEQPLQHAFPSTILRTHPGAVLFLDTRSSELLGTKIQ